MQRLVDALLYFPSRSILQRPGIPYEDVAIETEDGERLHGWRVEGRAPKHGGILLCHGNAGNVGDRVLHLHVLSAAGFDVLAFDYRGYGLSTGRPSEEGLIRDARAARRHLAGDRVFYLGESLGGAVALALALEDPPAGLILVSAFTSLRDMARLHYRVPAPLVPNAFASLERVSRLRVPLLVLHGGRDDIVPPAHGEALAAAGGGDLHVLPHAGHNDIVGQAWADAIAEWASS